LGIPPGVPFDLNIEQILENWETHDGTREVIANAIDEQIMTNTRDIEIYKDKQRRWHIRDYGRGLQYAHLTQKENKEKLTNPNVIGKFGIGLKDALATFDRKGARVLIRSRFNDIVTAKYKKHGFNLETLHAFVAKPSDPTLVGTEFIISGITDQDVAKAKDLFLRFSGEDVVEHNQYGDVLEKKGANARIYANGVKVAEEENFLFSYNIAPLTKRIKAALNRERTNVGRTAYSDRVKTILISSKSTEIARRLANDLKNYITGNMHAELDWVDVQEHAVKTLNATKRVLFVTIPELTQAKDLIDEAKKSGIEIITIPEILKLRIQGKKDYEGNAIRVLKEFLRERDESFEFKFVDANSLNVNEREIFSMTESIFDLIDGRPKVVKSVKVSETMRRDPQSFVEVEGLWEKEKQTIIIKRSTLRTLEKYGGTLLHEATHAKSGTRDVTSEFESELTDSLGEVASNALSRKISSRRKD
jgi:hypothetical protein